MVGSLFACIFLSLCYLLHFYGHKHCLCGVTLGIQTITDAGTSVVRLPEIIHILIYIYWIYIILDIWIFTGTNLQGGCYAFQPLKLLLTLRPFPSTCMCHKWRCQYNHCSQSYMYNNNK